MQVAEGPSSPTHPYLQELALGSGKVSDRRSEMAKTAHIARVSNIDAVPESLTLDASMPIAQVKRLLREDAGSTPGRLARLRQSVR